MFKLSNVSIHAFRGEGDLLPLVAVSARGRVSIHAFRGEGDQYRAVLFDKIEVSIHAFRGEGDLHDESRGWQQIVEFQSTPSGGKATGRPARLGRSATVSIHAFRGEGDTRRMIL